jgi:hypothetical protein
MAAIAALRSWQVRHLQENRAFYLLDHKLRNPVAPPELDRLLGIGVQQNHLDLATVPGIDGAWRIDDGHAAAGSQAGARMHEPGVPIRQCNAHAGADHCPFPWLEHGVRSDAQVTASVTRMGTLR